MGRKKGFVNEDDRLCCVKEEIGITWGKKKGEKEGKKEKGGREGDTAHWEEASSP